MAKRYTEYGLYIRKASKTDDYVVGFYDAGPVAHFPTYDDAEIAVNEAIDRAWSIHGGDVRTAIIESLI